MKKLALLAATAALTCGMAFAQDQPATSVKPDGRTETAAPQQARQDATPRHETNYGWIGLLGLAGLAGLARRRDHHVETRTVHEPRDVRVVGVKDDVRRDDIRRGDDIRRVG